MRQVADWLLSTCAAMLLVAWCCACITLPLLLVDAVPWPAWLDGAAAVAAGIGGLLFALRTTKRISGHSRL